MRPAWPASADWQGEACPTNAELKLFHASVEKPVEIYS
jgi:hypothetical protein